MARPDLLSPCTKVCVIDGQAGLCLGCARTLKEIGAWGQLGNAGRRKVMDKLPARMDSLHRAGKLEPRP